MQGTRLGADGLSARACTSVLTSAAAKGVEPMQAAKAKISAAERCSAASLLSAATLRTESASTPALCATSSRLPTSPTEPNDLTHPEIASSHLAKTL